MRPSILRASVLAATLLGATSTRANEADTYGLGSRSTAMGGAVVADDDVEQIVEGWAPPARGRDRQPAPHREGRDFARDGDGRVADNRGMHQATLDNRTDFAVHHQVLLDAEGEKLVAMVKATFELHGAALVVAPAERTRGIRFVDVPWDKERPESIAYPADVCLHKPGTDVVFVARACAPGGRPEPTFAVRVEVGPLCRSLQVFGQRLWVSNGGGLTAPQPIAEIDLRYDYAWGGRDDSDPAKLVEEPRNPVGMGVTRDPAALTHRPAPNIEDPAIPIRSVRTAPPPAGIGVVGRSWEPRRRYAGTYDAAWQELRAPLLPDDFDDRYNLCASPGLIAVPPLAGGEPVRLLNLMPGGGALTFELPRVKIEIELRVKDREPAVFTPHLDTVLVDTYAPSDQKPPAVELVWRASVKAPRKLKDARILVRGRVSA